MTPLFQAVSCNNLECVQYLVTSGAIIDTRDNVGRTPVALAAYQVLLLTHYHYKMYTGGAVCPSSVLFCFPLLLPWKVVIVCKLKIHCIQCSHQRLVKAIKIHLAHGLTF